MRVTDADRKRFLDDDFYNTLRYLFEGAVAWHAARAIKNGELRHHAVLGMYTTFIEARALYDFFHVHGDRRKDDDARADDFASTWKAPESDVYKKYMAPRKPANKRMFHLVYRRSQHSGGTGGEGKDDLNEQVLNVAKDLHELTKVFVGRIDVPAFQEAALAALKKAENESQKAAEHYQIDNPLFP